MIIQVNIVKEYDIPDGQMDAFKRKCLEYVEERFEDCAIKGYADIPEDIVLGVITDSLPEIIQCGGYSGVIIDEYFHTISFNFYAEDVIDLVKECVKTILTDIDYEPKFKQLIELSDNQVTGYFDKEETQVNASGFNLYSQAATLRVRFNPPTKVWKVWMYDENCGEEEYNTGCGWNSLIDHLCGDIGYTWFINMSAEQIQMCKLWKERK